MRILVVAPLPPPITGHSLASQVLVEGLRPFHDVDVVDLSEGSRHDGTVTPHRLRTIGKALAAVQRRQRAADAVYVTISESLTGNAKDLLIYCLCAPRLERVYLHLHGGTIGRELFERHGAIKRVNAALIRRMAGVIVSGPSHENIFAGMIERERIHTVPNFAHDTMFVAAGDVERKFRQPLPLRVLYLSAMTEAKGYRDLAEAYAALDAETRGSVRLDFAGRFESAAEERAFRERIRGVDGIEYHGVVDDAEKRRLFAAAHLFCLPTAMLEGQPISILEAYASGCAVIATGQRGIRDVFEDGVNGFELARRDAASIADCLSKAAANVERLAAMATANRALAEERYRTATFSDRLRRILEAGHAPLR